MTDDQFETFCKILADTLGKKKSAEVWWIRGGVTIVCALLIAGILGMVNMNKTQAVQGTQLNHVQSEVGLLRNDIRAGMDDRYRSTDAKADFLLRDKAIAELDAKIQKLANDFHLHENLPHHDVAGSALSELRRRVTKLEEGK